VDRIVRRYFIERGDARRHDLRRDRGVRNPTGLGNRVGMRLCRREESLERGGVA
jgi:hypothetical protein